MPKTIELNSPWSLRIKNAERYYTQWSNEYKCNELEAYYKGKQTKLKINSLFSVKPYTLNLVYATIRRKIANMIYTYPEFSIDPRPGMQDWNQEFAIRSAQTKQDALNTLIQNPNFNFVRTTKKAALDAFFRFGVIEVGYSANILNPFWDEESARKHEQIIEQERVYAKWIPARRFRVSMSDDVELHNCNWCGYYEWIPKETLENTKEIDFPKTYNQVSYSVDFADPTMFFGTDAANLTSSDKLSISKEVLDAARKGTLCKVWHIVDNVENKRLLLLDGNFEELFSKDIERIPFITHRIDEVLEGWYPVPPVWNWLSAQDEINESREQMRRYRRRFNRKFEYYKGTIDPDEIDKFTLDEDGTVIQVKKPAMDGGTAIRAISNPEIGPTVAEGLIASKDDWNIVTGNAIARGRPSDRQTATATKKQASDEVIVENAEQVDFSIFMSEVGREILLQAGENLSQGMWIKLTADPGTEDDLLQEIQENKVTYKYITTQDISDGYDFDIRLSINNATPAQMEAQEISFTKFLALVTQFPMVALSPTLIRETAYRTGYRNERVIRQMQRMALLAMAEKAAAQQQSLPAAALFNGNGNGAGGAGNNQGNFAKGIAEQNQPNSIDEIRSQLMNQG